MKRFSESPSSLVCYNSCPQKYAYKYRDKLKDPMSPAAELGNLFHNAAYQTWQTRDTSHIADDQVRRMLDAMYSHPDIIALPREFAFAPEQKVKADFGGQTLFGVIDMGLTDDSVNDFKTSGKKWTLPKIAEQVQHFSYTWLARMNKLSPAKVFRYIVVTTTQNPFVQVITMNVSEAGIEAYLHGCRETTGYIELDLFYPTPSRGCSWCPYKNLCPAFTPTTNAPTRHIQLDAR